MVIPQVGKLAIPEIYPPERPETQLYTQEELDSMPITVKGKILKTHTSWVAYADLADAAIQAYRDYLAGVFGGEGN